MSQFSCQGVSLPGSEEKQGKKKMNPAGTRPRTRGYVWARPMWVSSCTRKMCARRRLELLCSPGISRLSPATQPGARQGEKPASSRISPLYPHSSRGDGKRRCCFSREVPRWWCARSAARNLLLSWWEQITERCHGNAAVLQETRERLIHVRAVTGTTGKDGPTCIQLSRLCTRQAPSFCPSQSRSISCAGPLSLQDEAPARQ